MREASSLLQCHYSYNACGLGSDGTDRLVKLVQDSQLKKPSTSENGALFGAKITGGGSGGSVCVLGRNSLQSTQQIFEVLISISRPLFSTLAAVCLKAWRIWPLSTKIKLFLFPCHPDSTKVQSCYRLSAVLIRRLITRSWEIWLSEDSSKKKTYFLIREISK